MKKISFILAALLLTLAAGCSEQAIERAPVVHLIVCGQAVDGETGLPVEGLQVSLFSGWLPIYSGGSEPISPPVRTDKTGAYRIEFTGTPFLHCYLEIEDIDGPEHGGQYGDTFCTTSINYADASLRPTGDIWDFGTVTIELSKATMYLLPVR